MFKSQNASVSVPLALA